MVSEYKLMVYGMTHQIKCGQKQCRNALAVICVAIQSGHLGGH
jgi:hypothetical protein